MKIAKWLILLLATQIYAAAAASVDANKSSVTASFKQMGVEVAAKFTRVSGTIDFDPANVASAKAQFAVDTASFDLGEPEYNKEVQKKEWLSSAQFPQATFISSAIKSIAPGKLSVQGKLTVKGRTLDALVPVSFRQEGKSQIFEGQFPIKRLYFDIGEGEWKETDMVADDVIVKFKVVTAN